MSSRTRIARRVAIAVAVVLVVALVVGSSVLVWVMRRPLPALAGTTTIAALDANVTITRDERGVPQIWAETDRDLFMAQGWVHAQDRFFEMDYRRHVTAGRLSELVGDVADARTADTVIRTLGWRRVAEQEWELLGEESQAYLEAYADGVNAYLDGREASELGMEYTVLGLQVELSDIEPWSPIDSLAWLKAMAWDLRANYDQELERARTYRTVGNLDRVAELFPAYPYDAHEPIIPAVTDPSAASATVDASWPALDQAADAIDGAILALDAVPRLVGGADGIGSNSFVISGQYTESGLPLLANDPHLTVGAPSIWHQIGLHCVEPTRDCTFDVAGFGFSGLPGVIIGHNRELSWGLTNMGADVTDFFLERVYPEGDYQRGEERVPLEARTEVIDVAGGEPFEVEILSTVHGPIISTALPDSAVASGAPVPGGSPSGGLDGYAVALAWTALQPGRSVEAIFALDRAATADDVAAAAAMFEAPAQNIVFATAAGDIGYQAPGSIPIRSQQVSSAVPVDGSWPRPGWDPAFDWEGVVPAENLPRALNPAEGFIVAANQAVTVPGGGPFLTVDFDHGYRSDRLRSLIEERIAAGEAFTVEGANQLMMDSANPLADLMVPAILRLTIEDPFVDEAVAELRIWRDAGYPNDADSAGAAYFNAVWANLLALTFADELPEGSASMGGSRWMWVVSLLMEDPRNVWWDDVSTIAVTETRDELLVRALENARYELTNSLGKDADRWRWGDLHQAHFEHPLLNPTVAPGVLAWLTNPTPFEVSGSSAAVNATSWSANPDDDGRVSYAMTASPSMRMVVDLANLDASTWVVTTGVSGHPTSPNWSDQTGAWGRGEHFSWPFTRPAVDESATHTLVLTPGE